MAAATILAAPLAYAQAVSPVDGTLQQTSLDISELSIEQLADIEITSVSRRPESLAKAMASVFVISSEDVRRSGAINLPETLRLAPALEVARMNGFGYTVSARGFNSPESSNKLLVLVDGRSVYSPLASSVFWENVDVALPDVARIEVISGPGGTLYGANAVNGVINIVTKTAGETQGLLADVTAGTTDNKLMLRYGATPWENASLRLYGQVSHANDTTPVSALDLSRTGWARNQGGFRLDQKLGGDTLTLQGDIYANHTPAMAGEYGRGYNVAARWSHPFEGGDSIDVHLVLDEATRILPLLAREQLNTTDLQVQHNTSLGWGDTFIIGGEYKRWKESFYTQGGFFGFANPTTTIDVINAFAQDQVPLTDDLTLTLGIKVESNSYVNVDFLPNIRLGWQVSEGHFLWTAVSRATRAPSKVDRELMATGLLDPAPRFRAEKLTAFEIGYRGEPLERVSLSVSTYYNQYDDLRTTHGTPVTIFPVQLRNGIAGDSYGAEAWARYTPLEWWRLSLGGSWLQRLQTLKPSRNDLTFGQSLGQDPPYQAQLRSEMNPFTDWELDLGLRAIGHVKVRNATNGATNVLVPSYVEADARIGWRIADSAMLSLIGSNLLNQRHLEASDPSTYPPQYVPRSVMLNLRKSF